MHTNTNVHAHAHNFSQATITAADIATKKLLAEADAAQEVLLQQVQDDLKAGTDAMDATFSTWDSDADDKGKSQLNARIPSHTKKAANLRFIACDVVY